MKKFKYLQRMEYLIIFTLFSFSVSSLHSKHALGQSTWQEVYTIFQSIGTIDSVDFATTTMANAYTSIFDQPTANTFAQSKGYTRIDPGHPHYSFLFRKINNGLDADIVLDPGEGVNVAILSNENKELIRQWILWGAPETGVVADTALINDYYNGNGLASVPIPPAAPAPSEGFQIHFGPYFIAPFGELEYFLKIDPHLADTIEIYRTDVIMGDDYSHHFILYRIENDASGTPEGLRPGHTTDPVAFVTGAQFTNSVFLPANTAFVWPQAALLDLNSHHINQTPSVMKAEVYINIYTQTKGTAKQIMHTDLVLGAFPIGLVIWNDGNTYTFEDSFIPQNDGLNDIFVWGMTSHTHQWGVDFDIYKRNTDGTKGVQYFDASHKNGDPNDTLKSYDYDRPPSRNYDYPFLLVPKNEGLIQEASYINTGPNSPVTWGFTSVDEMMIMVLLYVTDTTGLFVTTTAISENSVSVKENIEIFPNPFTDKAILFLSSGEQASTGSGSTCPFTTFTLYDVLGTKVKQIYDINSQPLIIERNDLSSGVYFYQVSGKNEVIGRGKLIIY
ncbi:MAG: T9SS type A sorting domain-containing protein [Cytophagales bacterium]|nr:T9SS type A sorting domain-containing protein [Cytophagales bacterium]